MPSVTLRLTPPEVVELQKPVNGRGGWQTLARALAQALDANTGEIELDDELLGKAVRYASYAQGGFQGRLRDAFRREIENLLA